MDYSIVVTEKPAYLHAVVTGRNSPANVAACLEDIRRECIARGFARVLIEEHLEGPQLGTTDVFEIVSRASAKALGVVRAVAYVDVHAGDSLMKFAETVAVNRWLRAAVFGSVAEAEKWLLSEAGGGDAPGAPPPGGLEKSL